MTTGLSGYGHRVPSRAHRSRQAAASIARPGSGWQRVLSGFPAGLAGARPDPAMGAAAILWPSPDVSAGLSTLRKHVERAARPL
jgi:hypothetical protein